MPRIAAPTVAENRELRREALLSAAAALMLRHGTFTVAEVAREVGLSRSAVYEYYSSAAELIADVLVDELTGWSEELSGRQDPQAAPIDQVHTWIDGVLAYVRDGRHALLVAAGSVELPEGRRDEVQLLHAQLVAPLVDALSSAGIPHPVRTARYVWGVVNVAVVRIEQGEADPDDEAAAVTAFVDAALRSGTQPR